MDKDIRAYFIPRRALLERKIIHKYLTVRGITVSSSKECIVQHKSADFSSISAEKQIFVRDCFLSKHWHYEQAYYLTSEHLNNSGSFKRTLLPTTTYAKSKLIIVFPEGILHYIRYAVTVQGVEISSGKLTIYDILGHIDENRDLNLDPLILRTLPFLTLIYNITHAVG